MIEPPFLIWKSLISPQSLLITLYSVFTDNYGNNNNTNDDDVEKEELLEGGGAD